MSLWNVRHFIHSDLIERVSDVLAVRAHKKGLELGVFIADDVPPYVYGDPTRLRQILINLIGNAVKFTEKGDIFVKVTLGATELQALPGNSIPLVFSIRDTGIGIPR
jgi:signal transduction histidine kinase